LASVENPKPSDLVMLPYREIQCDDTLREFIQILRFDLVDVPHEPLRAQLLLDRRHKLNKSQSKPVAYFRMSSTDQLIKLGNTALALATVMAFSEQGRLEPTHDEVKSAVKSLLQLSTQIDVANAIEVILRDVKLRRMALAKETQVDVRV